MVASHKKSVDTCAACQHRHESPICSVDGAFDKVRSARTSKATEAGEALFHQGGVPEGLYVIESGLVKLETVTKEGAVHTLRLLGPGQILGYRALFSDEKYNASAVAVEASNICFLHKKTVNEILHDHPQVAVNLLCQISKDLKAAEGKWVTQIDKSTPERIAEALLFLSEKFHDQDWTRKEIAQWAGTTPETVMRTLAQFEKDGLISQNGRKIEILQKDQVIRKMNGA